MLQVYPQLADTNIDYGWGGTLAIYLKIAYPHFGRVQDNIWYMQGYSGHGVPTATFAGKLIAEAISGKLERFDLMANLPHHQVSRRYIAALARHGDWNALLRP